MSVLLDPFAYGFMSTAIWVAALVGGLCAFLSAFLMLRGWSLIADALSHAIVPGVAGAWMLGLPFTLGAFLSAGLATGAMMLLNQRTGLKEDTIIGIVFTGFFGAGLFMISLSPVPIDIQTIIMGNILAIPVADTVQLVVIAVLSLAVMGVIWKDLMVSFFDEMHARSIGLRTGLLRALFFAILAASCVAAMQTVGAFLVVALIVTPGATAWLLTDRFPRLLALSVAIGAVTGFAGAYLSFFLDGATGGVIICLQTALFLAAFLFAPRHGLLAASRRTAGTRAPTARDRTAR